MAIAREGFSIIFVLALAAPVRANAPSEARRLYEQKCLYCHSGAAAERQRLDAFQWRRLIARMRGRAPLLISKREAETIARFFINERRQTRSDPRARPQAVVAAQASPPSSTLVRPQDPAPVAAGCCTPAASCCPPTAAAEREEPEVDDPEAEERGPRLFADRCSKCHTVRRAYLRIDSVEAGRLLIDRMRRKMGSGITGDDADMLERFLRVRIGRTP